MVNTSKKIVFVSAYLYFPLCFPFSTIHSPDLTPVPWPFITPFLLPHPPSLDISLCLLLPWQREGKRWFLVINYSKGHFMGALVANALQYQGKNPYFWHGCLQWKIDCNPFGATLCPIGYICHARCSRWCSLGWPDISVCGLYVPLESVVLGFSNIWVFDL